MTDDVMRPGGRVKRTIYYGLPREGAHMLDAAESALFPKREHPEFPVTDALRTAARESIAAVCRTVEEHTVRWGTPESGDLSTWACVAWEKRQHAQTVLALVAAPTLDLEALRDALAAWRKYGL
jgi:hypothetical protein